MKICFIADCGQAPEILEHPTDVVVARNEPVTLNCKVSGDPEPSVEWFKDGEGVTTARDDPRSHRYDNDDPEAITRCSLFQNLTARQWPVLPACSTK